MTRHSLLWLLAIIAIFLFAPLVITHAEYRACIERELADASQWYGDEEVEAIVARANGLYGMAMVTTKIDPIIRKNFVKPIPSREVAPGVAIPKSMESYTDHLMEYWGNLLENVWLFCLRLSHSWSWIIYLTPFLLAALFDGIMTRKAKLASFKYTSPTIYNLSWHAIIFMVACSVVAFAVITPITVFYYPIILTGICMLVRLVISNIQHSA